MAFRFRGLARWSPFVMAAVVGCEAADRAPGVETGAGSATETGSEAASGAGSAPAGRSEGASGAEPEPETGSAAATVPAAELPLVKRAIEAHGGDGLREATVEFDFRGDHYRVWRDGGLYRYERTKDMDGETVRDVLSNDGFERFVDGERVELPERKAQGLASSVDSVVYFALLPFFLGDPGVLAEPVGDVEVDGETYARVRITFEPTGGEGEHRDVYMYWFERDTLHMEYLAYKFSTGDGGVRFREAMNRREVGGVTFADYENYGLPEDDPMADRPMDVALEGLLERHLAGELRHVSTVAIAEVSVERHDQE